MERSLEPTKRLPLSVLCISTLTMFPSASLRICLFKMLRQLNVTKRRHEEWESNSVEGKELKSQPLHMTGTIMEATRSFYAKHSQTRGIFGEISILLCFTLVHLMFSPCLDSRYQCNHIATNFSFSDSSFFKLLLRNGYLCLTAANAHRRISDQFLQYLHSL